MLANICGFIVNFSVPVSYHLNFNRNYYNCKINEGFLKFALVIDKKKIYIYIYTRTL